MDVVIGDGEKLVQRTMDGIVFAGFEINLDLLRFPIKNDAILLRFPINLGLDLLRFPDGGLYVTKKEDASIELHPLLYL